MNRCRTLLVGSMLLLGACSPGDEPKDPPPAQGRAETQAIRNTEAVGVNGNAIADQVDQTLDAADKRKEQTDNEAEQ